MRYETRAEFIKALGVSVMPAAFGLNFEKTMSEYDEKGAPFLSDDFIDAIQNELGLFKQKFDFVKKEARRIRENEFMARYSLLLRDMLEDKEKDSIITMPEVPSSEDEAVTVDLEMAGFFAQLSYVPQMVEFFRSKGVPEKVILDTLDCFEGGILVCNGCFGRDGYETNRSFMWNQHYIAYHILRIGVLNFEKRPRFIDAARVFVNKSGECRLLSNNQSVSKSGQITGSAADPDEAFVAEYRETEDSYEGYEIDVKNALVTANKVSLSKKEWSLAVDTGDSVINVHIPESNAFNRENIETAYRECRVIFENCFPEFKPKAFTCFSWLMEPRLNKLLKENSNILAFQSKYMLFPRRSDGRAVFTFLFRRAKDTKVKELPAETSLQRKVKELYLNGGYIYEPCGVFLIDEISKA